MKSHFDTLAEMFQMVLAVHKKQQKELFAHMVVLSAFKQSYPQYAGLLDESLATARDAPVLEDQELAQFEVSLGKWLQSSPESLQNLDPAQMLAKLKSLLIFRK